MHDPQRPARRSSWHRRAGRPVRVWTAALLAVVLLHRWIPEARWLLVHLTTLGLVTNSVLVWSQHFTESLLRHRLPGTARSRQLARLGVLNAGIVLLVAGALTGWWWASPAGASAVGAAVAWHGAALLAQLRTALPSRFAVTVRYYAAAALLLPVGAVLGAVLAAGLPDRVHARVLLAHETVNVLGFVGLTVAGTLLTLWPTVLRTRMREEAVRVATRALGALAGGVVLTGTGALLGSEVLALAGLAGYGLGLGAVLVVMVRTARARPPVDHAGLCLAAGTAWWAATVVALAVLLVRGGFDAAALGRLTVPLVAGFLVQVLLGAMSYLLPVTMGGGPAVVRAAHRALGRGAAFRVVVVNLCVLLFALPPGTLPSWVRVSVSALGAAVLFAVVPLTVSAARISVAGRRAARAAAGGPAAAAAGPGGTSTAAAGPGGGAAAADRPAAGGAGTAVAAPPGAAGPDRPARQARGALAGVLAVVLAVAAGIAADPAAAGLGAPAADGAGTAPTGETTVVRVAAREGMRFEPAVVEVPAGDELVIELVNEDPSGVHDLVLDSGAGSGRLAPGQSATVEAGVVGASLAGWCSVVGHRSAGMTLEVVVLGPDGRPVAGGTAGTSAGGPAAAPDPAAAADLAAAPGPEHTTRSPVLEPVAGPVEDGRRVHRVRLEVEELDQELAPGVRLRSWTYGGRYTGPTLHGEVGDVFEVELRNGGTTGHSVDFHAGVVAPDGPMRTVPPGESLTYRFEAVRSGTWLYHCATAPMSSHVAAGMFGAVVVDPPGLPPVDREYLLVHSEAYLAPGDGPGTAVVSPERVRAGTPSLTVFNGHATQYLHEPLRARVGERVRIRLLAAGPSGGLSFHVVGGQFDTVHKEGAYLLRPGGPEQGGAQALDLAPAQGGFVELTFAEPGTYPFLDHDLAAAERGARGLIRVEG
ncbi:copper oxidase [Kocuria flava]|uniref:Copper-containing nitrite reductase n=1 Tax=Kocuria flava TaxID=446860 RepID=A0A0U2NYA2_9MICC|nr:multicopper oxidase domain-containing protein [Kocuria flava]ALU39309.1 copper oxidase [Kocuria flava]GEO93142.1 hypothetical protein KFL01_24480 [Kocuria flava]